MDINVDLNDVISELLEQVKALTLENIILKKALSNVNDSTPSPSVSADTALYGNMEV